MNPKITFRIEGSDAFRVFIVKTILTNGLSETFRRMVPEEHGKPDFVVSDTIPDGNTLSLLSGNYIMLMKLIRNSYSWDQKESK